MKAVIVLVEQPVTVQLASVKVDEYTGTAPFTCVAPKPVLTAEVKIVIGALMVAMQSVVVDFKMMVALQIPTHSGLVPKPTVMEVAPSIDQVVVPAPFT